jgi:hypothetical protein
MLNGPEGASIGYHYHIGVDYDKAYSTSRLRTRSAKLCVPRVRNAERSVVGFLLPFSENPHTVMEAM